jgi:type IV pilus assembly protein PilV
MMYSYTQKNKQKGFTLLEILISVLILSIGLLGLAGLQLTALRSNTSAYNRSLATTLAYDIADRMRANKVATDAGAYLTDIDTGPSGAGNCVGAGNNCDAGTLAAFDLDEWKCQLGAHNDEAACQALGLHGDLPRGVGEITRNGTIFSITVMWDDERTDPPGTACGGDPEVDLTCFTMAFEPPPLM